MKIVFAWTGTFAAAALLAATSPAQGACAMKAFPIPVKMDGMRPTVTAKLDGQEGRFLVDSGAFNSGVADTFVVKRKLGAVKTGTTGTHLMVPAGEEVEGVAGAPGMSAVVHVEELNLSGIRFTKWSFLTLRGWSEEDRVGLLGQDILGQMDVEYDLAHDVIRMVQPKDCKDANLAYWAPPGSTYSVMPLVRSDQGNAHTEGTVFINGVKMRAMFDTGAETSFITEAAAGRAGVKVTDPGLTYTGYVSGLDGRVKSWSGRFASVKVGDEEIRNGLLEIGRTSADFFDILIGADFFLSHHVYVANSQRQIYFTYNGGRVFNIGHTEEAAAQALPREPLAK